MEGDQVLQQSSSPSNQWLDYKSQLVGDPGAMIMLSIFYIGWALLCTGIRGCGIRGCCNSGFFHLLAIAGNKDLSHALASLQMGGALFLISGLIFFLLATEKKKNTD